MYIPSFIRTRLATLPASTVLIINVQAYGGSGEVEKPAAEVADYLAGLQRGKVYALQVSICEQHNHRRTVHELVCWYHDDNDHHDPAIAADQDQHWHDWQERHLPMFPLPADLHADEDYDEALPTATPRGWDRI